MLPVVDRNSLVVGRLSSILFFIYCNNSSISGNHLSIMKQVHHCKERNTPLQKFVCITEMGRMRENIVLSSKLIKEDAHMHLSIWEYLCDFCV